MARAKSSGKQFEEMVARSMKELPEHVRKRIKNVAVCVQDKPTRAQLQETGARRGSALLGLFEGVPETEWGKGFGNMLPDKITIFRENIERLAKTPAEIEREVRLTVLHEIAHHFGFEEEELERRERTR